MPLYCSARSERSVFDLGFEAYAAEVTTIQQANGFGESLTELRSSLSQSAEFAADVNALYQSNLGRGATAADLTAQQNIVASGESLQGALAGVRSPIAYSAEAAGLIEGIEGIERAVLGQQQSDVITLAVQKQIADGTLDLAGVRTFFGTSDQVAAGINALYQADLGHAADPVGIAAYETALSQYASWTDVRNSIAYSPQAAAALLALAENELGRPVSDAEVLQWQASLASGASLADIRTQIAYSAEIGRDINAAVQSVSSHNADPASLAQIQAALASRRALPDVEDFIVDTQFAAGDANATAVAVNLLFQQVLGREVDASELSGAEAVLFGDGLADPWGQLRQNVAYSAEAASDVNALYEDVLGRQADAGGLATYQGLLAQGASLGDIRHDLAQSGEAVGVIQNFYQVNFGRAASADEVAGMQFALGLSISGTDTFGLYNTQNQPLAVTDAASLLTQLPVAVTLDNGVTPQFTYPGNGDQLFANATQLAAALLGLALRQGQANLGTPGHLPGDGGLAGADRPTDAAGRGQLGCPGPLCREPGQPSPGHLGRHRLQPGPADRRPAAGGPR